MASISLVDSASDTPTASSSSEGFVRNVWPAVDLGDATTLRLDVAISAATTSPSDREVVLDVRLEHRGDVEADWRALGEPGRATRRRPGRVVVGPCDRYVRAVTLHSAAVEAITFTVSGDAPGSDASTRLDALEAIDAGTRITSAEARLDDLEGAP